MEDTVQPDATECLEHAWHLRDSDPPQALQMANTVEAQTDDPQIKARCSILRAFLLFRQDELQEALPLSLDAAAQVADSPIDAWHGRASNTAALVYSRLGLSVPAVEWLLKGQKQSQQVGDFETAFSAFHNMAVELGQMSDFEGAIKSFDEAEAYVDYGQDAKAFLAFNRCDLYLEIGDVEKAVSTIREGRQHWRTDCQARVFGLLVESRVALAADDPQWATTALRTLRAEFDPARAGSELPLLEAQLALHQGQLDRAEEILVSNDMDESSTVVEDVYLAESLVELHAQLAEARGDFRRALSIVRSAQTKSVQERRESMSRVTTLLIEENNRQLNQKSQELLEQNRELNKAVEELRLLHEQVNELSLRDHLTGLYNRRYLADHVPGVVEHHQRHQHDLSLLVFDIDNFKLINDTHLHSTGDIVLRLVAAILQTHKRAGDVLCRLGGDEFVALLPETDLDGARSMANHIHAAIEEHEWSGVAEDLEVSVSVGAATARPGNSLEDLLVAADRAMYGAKTDGKNRVRIAPA